MRIIRTVCIIIIITFVTITKTIRFYRMTKKGFIGINLPIVLVDELKLWKRAFSNTYNKNVTYEEMFREMIDALKKENTHVSEEFESMIEKHPELKDQFDFQA